MSEETLAAHVIIGTIMSSLIMVTLFIGVLGLPWSIFAEATFLIIWLFLMGIGTVLSLFIFSSGVLDA